MRHLGTRIEDHPAKPSSIYASHPPQQVKHKRLDIVLVTHNTQGLAASPVCKYKIGTKAEHGSACLGYGGPANRKQKRNKAGFYLDGNEEWVKRILRRSTQFEAKAVTGDLLLTHQIEVIETDTDNPLYPGTPRSSLRATGADHAARMYPNKAIRMTAVMPKWIAINVAITALTTEAQPLIPQAQGINGSELPASRDNPKGNGIPMKKASGAMHRMEMPMRIQSTAAMEYLNTNGSTNRYRMDTKQIAATTGHIERLRWKRSKAFAKPLPIPAKTRNPVNTTATA